MLGRLATNFVAILASSWRADSLTGPAKVIDGDTIVVAGELVRLHGIDAPELDQTFRGNLADSGIKYLQSSSRKCPESGVCGFNSLQIRTGNFSARTPKPRYRRMSLGLHGVLTTEKARRMAFGLLAAVKDGKDPLAALAHRHQLGLDLPAALDREADGVCLRASGHGSACLLRSGACEGR